MIKLRNIIIILLLLVISKNILLGIFTNNDELIIHGKISPYYTYTIKTYYEAQSSLPICYGFGSGILWGGSLFSKKSTKFLYEPTINKDMHTISIPLGYPGLNICDYRLSRVSLDVPNDNDLVLFKNYVDLTYVGYAKPYVDSNNRTSRVIPILKAENNNSYTIDFYSSSDYALYQDKQMNIENLKNLKQKKYNASLRRTSKDDIRPSIRQRLPDPLYNKNHQFKKKAMHTLKSINLLTSLLTKFQYKYKKVANNQEAKELFKKHSKFNIQPTDSWGEKFHKSDLNYINDEPVDDWNHPFVYDIESDKNHPIIYSLGEDGVKSGDDIKRKMYRLF